MATNLTFKAVEQILKSQHIVIEQAQKKEGYFIYPVETSPLTPASSDDDLYTRSAWSLVEALREGLNMRHAMNVHNDLMANWSPEHAEALAEQNAVEELAEARTLAKTDVGVDRTFAEAMLVWNAWADRTEMLRILGHASKS